MKTDKTNSGESLSSWMDVPRFHPEIRARAPSYEVAVIGAGIAGLCTAYHLVQAGKSVIVIDRGTIAGGQTGRTTSHLTWAVDKGLEPLKRIHGEENARMIVEAHREAINRIESIVRDEKISCEFQRVPGFLFSTHEDSSSHLEDELEAWIELEIADVKASLKIPSVKGVKHSSICFENQAQLHPLKFATALAETIEKRGGHFLEFTKVEKIEDGEWVHISLEDGSVVTCRQAVVATNSPINDRWAIHTKQSAYRSYALSARIPRGSVVPALFWDTDEPYHYVRLTRDPISVDHDLLIVGGEDHKTGQDNHPEKRFLDLQSWALKHFPQILGFVDRWSGQVWEPVDRVAFIGKNPGDEKIFVVTGDSGQGMTHGMIAGLLLNDLLHSRENPWTEIFDPSRKSLSTALDYIRENLNVAIQYTDHLKPGEIENPEEIIRGEGAVVQRGIHKVAVSRDENGKLHECSAICTHLGGVVHWNSLEKSWDCPCHGSRFSMEGEVITGPALEPLEKTQFFVDPPQNEMPLAVEHLKPLDFIPEI